MILSPLEWESAGRLYPGTLVVPEGTRSSPAVLVFHGGAGPGAHELERARRLAELGYAAFVPDLFGGPFASREEGVATIQSLVADPARLRTRLADALERLAADERVDRSRVAALGFCFGGLAALELARAGAELRAAVALHGGLATGAPARSGEVRARVLVCTGARDPFVTRAHRDALEEELSAAGVDWELHVYANAAHGFTEQGAARPGSAYDERADRRSWSATTSLLSETLAVAG